MSGIRCLGPCSAAISPSITAEQRTPPTHHTRANTHTHSSAHAQWRRYSNRASPTRRPIAVSPRSNLLSPASASLPPYVPIAAYRQDEETHRIKPKDEPTAPKMAQESDWEQRRVEVNTSCPATFSSDNEGRYGSQATTATWYS